MSSMPEGWSVDVDGTQIIVCVSDRPDDRFRMTMQEARTLRNQLHVAYLVAWRDMDSVSGIAPDSDSNALAVSPAALPALNEADELPINWGVGDTGESVEVKVPVSPDEGQFTLSDQEAFAIGRALVRHAGRAHLARLEARRLVIEETSGTLDADGREGWAE